MKKFLSILIVPLVAVLMLCGCGRTMRTVDEIKTLFEQNSGKYNEAKINDNDVNTNWYFKNGDNKYILRVLYENSSKLNEKVNKTNLDTGSDATTTLLNYKYMQLRTVYERELAMIFAYYNLYADTFYSLVETKGITSEELTNLYDKIRDMFKQLESFNLSKLDLEREVRLYGESSGILSASVDRFNYAYNQLVEKSLDMVKYFRDLRYKYFVGENKIFDYGYLVQLHYDSLLTLAEFVYSNYLVPLTKNSVTTVADVKNSVTKMDNENVSFNIFENEIFNNIVKINGLNGVGDLVYVTKTSTAVTEARIRQFETSLKTFKQYYKICQKALNKVNISKFYDFRYQRNGVTIKDYKTDSGDIIDQVEFSNIKIIADFETGNLKEFLQAINSIIVK